MRKTLGPDDWAAAALAALASGGPRAVAVEPLAASLGTTKGSFYWHFSSRAALLAAALERWERHDTEDVIAQIDAYPGPAERLRALLLLVLESATHRVTQAVELGLQAHAPDPLVAAVLIRVARRRLDYLGGQFRLLGHPDDGARRRALMLYTAYLGHAQLVHATPELAPTGDGLRAYADELLALVGVGANTASS